MTSAYREGDSITGPCKAEYEEVVPIPDLVREIQKDSGRTKSEQTGPIHLDSIETCQDR